MNVLSLIFHDFGQTAYEVFIALVPIVGIFLILQIFRLHIKKEPFLRIIKGFVVVFVGLVLFMQGVHIAFLPVGTHIGEIIASLPYRWILIPLGFLMGFLVAFAEPAVHVMIKQVEELSSGTIKAKVMLTAISIGVAFAVSLGMVKMLYGLSLYWFVIPGYIIVFVLAKFCDPTFVAMAFDNGGVATGPMCSTFILAMSVAIAGQVEGIDPLIDGFGVVALIALAPIITTMILSFLYRRKAAKKEKSSGDQDPVDIAENQV